jgi:putative addiction module component (TIGR02574 family)
MLLFTRRYKPMSAKELLDQAMRLKAEDRLSLVEGLIQSLDEPDSKLDAIWAEEAERRLQAYREGRMDAIPAEEIFKEQ